MKVNEALNIILLSLLLDENLNWVKSDKKDTLQNNIEFSFGTKKVRLMCELYRKCILNDIDLYVGNIKVFADKYDREIMCYYSRFNLPHSEFLINENADADMLGNFISYCLPDHELIFDVSTHDYDDAIVKCAESLYLDTPINVAFNRIILSILLETDLIWQKGVDYVKAGKTFSIKLNGIPSQIECRIFKTNNDEPINKYIIEAEVKTNDGETVAIYESSFNAPLVDKKSSNESINAFINKYENATGTVYTTLKDYETDIISFANSLYSKSILKGKGTF